MRENDDIDEGGWVGNGGDEKWQMEYILGVELTESAERLSGKNTKKIKKCKSVADRL